MLNQKLNEIKMQYKHLNNLHNNLFTPGIRRKKTTSGQRKRCAAAMDAAHEARRQPLSISEVLIACAEWVCITMFLFVLMISLGVCVFAECENEELMLSVISSAFVGLCVFSFNSKREPCDRSTFGP